MTGVQTWSTTAANNVNASTGVNWDEGMSPGAVNNSARQVLADVRTAFNDLIWFQYGSGTSPVVTPVYVSGTSFKVAGVDVTVPYHVGRRVKAVGTSTGTIYGSISAGAFSTDTTVTVVWDSGTLSNETLAIYLAQVPVTGKPVPGLAIAGSGTATTYLKGDGTWAALNVPTRQNLTSGSAATYTTPAGARQLRIRMVGAGGGSGGGGGSSGSTAGGTGGTTTFNSINAVGGGGGGKGDGVVPGVGGTGGTGGTGSASFRAPGSGGGGGQQPGTGGGGYSYGMIGGSSPLGGSPAPNTNAGNAPAANTGAGASGTSSGSSSSQGGSGGAGEYVEIIINSPSATYTYTIGAGGTAGAAGNGFAGAIGGSGLILVDEIY